MIKQDTSPQGVASEEKRRAPEVAADGLERHVLYAMLRPAARLARRFRVPLKELGQWAEVGYFHELRRHDLKMREISLALEVSMRKAAQLSRQLKESFFEPERHGLARRIEFMVWTEPLSLMRLQQLIHDESAEEVERALKRLLREQRVVPLPGRVTTYQVAHNESRLVQGGLLERLDALNQLLDTISSAVEARFFDGDEAALVRNLELRVRRADLPDLRALYEELIFKRLSELDESARGDPDSLAVDFAVCWAPRREELAVHDESVAMSDQGGEERS